MSWAFYLLSSLNTPSNRKFDEKQSLFERFFHRTDIYGVILEKPLGAITCHKKKVAQHGGGGGISEADPGTSMKTSREKPSDPQNVPNMVSIPTARERWIFPKAPKWVRTCTLQWILYFYFLLLPTVYNFVMKTLWERKSSCKFILRKRLKMTNRKEERTHMR